MARTITKDALEAKIEKAQMNVIRTKAAYEKANDTLKDLLDKRDALLNEEVLEAIKRSSKSYEEIMEFLK